MDKKIKNIILIIAFIIVTIITIFIVINNNKIKIKEYSNNYYSFKYDTTWNLSEKNDELTLTHKKNTAKIKIKNKKLDDYLIDISLKDMLSDIKTLINEQNPDYQLINFKENNNNYDSYSFLYENDKEQALVNVYKKDSSLIILYYVADQNYFDIILDSADVIINSLNIKNITE